MKTLVEVAEFLGRLVGKTRVKTRTLMNTRILEERSGSAPPATPAARARWATMRGDAPRPRPVALPGPTVRPEQPLPCGCLVAHEADGTLQLRHCRTHVAAFEMLETLHMTAEILDQAIKHPPVDRDAVHRAQAAVRQVILKAKVAFP